MNNIVDFETRRPVDAQELADAEDTFNKLHDEMRECGEQVFDWIEEWCKAGHDGQAALWMVLRTAADVAYEMAPNEDEALHFINDAVSRDDLEAQQ